MRTLFLALAPALLFFTATPSYAGYSIDELSRVNFTGNSACNVTSREFYHSIQAATFYHQYDIENRIA